MSERRIMTILAYSNGRNRIVYVDVPKDGSHAQIKVLRRRAILEAGGLRHLRLIPKPVGLI